jgi:KAP family P-loop domain
MKLITPSLNIEQSNSFKNDCFHRKPFANDLFNLIKDSDDGLIISLDGQWGDGKTTFVKMWQPFLTEKSIPNLYIDVFQNDYSDDAFTTIISEIIAYIELHCPSEKPAFLEATKKVVKKILPLGAKIAIKALSLNLIDKVDIEEISKIKDDIATKVGDETEKILEERLNAHNNESNVIEVFKKQLEELPKKLSNQNHHQKLVIIIDELDRCRPSFAVEILEKIKHFFLVPNIFFVLVMNKKQIESSIQKIYGDIDAHTYLQKFIHVETRLPKNMGDSHYRHNISYVNQYTEKLFELHGMNQNTKVLEDKNGLIYYLNLFGLHFNLSLRQLEKIFTNLVLIYSSDKLDKDPIKKCHKGYITSMIVFISILKIKYPELFSQLSLRNLSHIEFNKKLKISEILKLSDNYSSDYKLCDDNLLKLINNMTYSIEEEQQLLKTDLSKLIKNNDGSNQIYIPNIVSILIKTLSFNVN